MFKDILKQLRINKGETQEDVAKALGVSTATIGNYELGIRIPKDDKMWMQLAKFFDVSVDYLMDNTPPTILQYNSPSNPQKDELIKLITKSKISDEQLKLLINMIKSWN